MPVQDETYNTYCNLLQISQEATHTSKLKGTLMFFKINDFFVFQDSNSVFFMFLNLRNCLLQFINKVALNVMCNVKHYFSKVIVI